MKRKSEYHWTRIDSINKIICSIVISENLIFTHSPFPSMKTLYNNFFPSYREHSYSCTSKRGLVISQGRTVSEASCVVNQGLGGGER